MEAVQNMTEYASPVISNAHGLRAGDWVEVLNASEILSTLDKRGRLDALPFMPEMLQYCGKRFRVFKSAHKTCDTLGSSRNRHMQSAVHLEGLRCDGMAHGGCQAACLLFWKESWLKRVEESAANENLHAHTPDGADSASSRCSVEALNRATRVTVANGDERYRCQATDMREATKPIRWWEIRHYAQDVLSRNERLRVFVRHGMTRAVINAFQAIIRLNPRVRRYPQYPMVRGLAGQKTPVDVLNLKPGELVQVRSK